MSQKELLNVDYKNRLFGDVLRDIVYLSGEDTYSFVTVTGIPNVMLSNLLNHKKYPGIKTLGKVARALQEEERNKFVAHFKNPETREWSVKLLKERGVTYPYPNSSRYDKDVTYTDMYKEVNLDNLSNLKLQGLFKYLTEEEKGVFKKNIAEYIIGRNLAMQQATEPDSQV